MKKESQTKTRIANSLNRILTIKEMKPKDLINAGFHKQTVYSILQRGASAKINYGIESLLDILKYLKVDLSEL